MEVPHWLLSCTKRKYYMKYVDDIKVFLPKYIFKRLVWKLQPNFL